MRYALTTRLWIAPIVASQRIPQRKATQFNPVPGLAAYRTLITFDPTDSGKNARPQKGDAWFGRTFTTTLMLPAFTRGNEKNLSFFDYVDTRFLDRIQKMRPYRLTVPPYPTRYSEYPNAADMECE